MTPRHLFQVLTLSLSTLLTSTSNINAQHLGSAMNAGFDKWYGGAGTLRTGAGLFHSLQLHQSIALRTTMLLSYSEPWTDMRYLQRLPTAGLTVQIAPTLVPRRGVFVRAGVDILHAFGRERSEESNVTDERRFRINGLIAGGIQVNKWEVGLQMTFRQPDTTRPAPLYCTQVSVARLLHSGSRRFAADRKWRKPLLPWQDARWADRSREWRAF